MSHSNEAKTHARELARPNWSAVFAVAFCVACLITVEFLPVSLLTPMALDLGISEGMAGQSVTTTAFVAMFSSLFITSVIGKTDRRYVVILFSLLLTLSCLLVSFADSFTLLLLGRACLGLALGGFWAMSASLTMRLVPMRVVPKALSIIFGAVSIALVIAAPLGSFLGGLIGWRNVFNGAAVMGVLCTIWVLKALPSLPGESAAQQQKMFGLLKRPGVMAGMCAIFMAFAGQFAFFTYIRPVYMTLAGFDVDGLTLVLLSFGIASFIGTSLLGAAQTLGESGAGDCAAGADRLRGGAGAVGGKQNRRLDGGDHLGLRVRAHPGGMVNVDHPFPLRSGGKSRVDSGGGDPAGQHLRRRGRRHCA